MTSVFEKIIKFIFGSFDKNQNQEKYLFWDNKIQVNKLNLVAAIKRVAKRQKSNLIFDPVGFDEWIHLSSNNKKKLKELIYEKFYPKQQITLSMPKGNFAFRPVSYLHPSNSIIYQALVDKLIMHKKDKFSNQVYSNIINDMEKDDVFDKPIKHWLRMNRNIREQYRKGNKFYFFSDISGYFENIKINCLFSRLSFYIGRNEKELESPLKKLLTKWQFAEAQGLVQPHNASSILAKIYLTPVDSDLSYLKGKYSRYVDEFHIITYAEKELLPSILILCERLRDIGLNINASKSKYLRDKEILDIISEDKAFFNLLDYLRYSLKDFDRIKIETDKKFDEFVNDFKNGKQVNMKIFRHCINKYIMNENPKAIDFCLESFKQIYDQIVDIVKYLSIFMNDKHFSKKILKVISDYLGDEENNYQWIQCWLLNLFIRTDNTNYVKKELLKKIFMDKNQNTLSRSTALLAYAKHSNDYELIFLTEIYKDSECNLFKRAILASASKLPRTYTKELFMVENNDELDIVVLKEYLQNNEYKIETRI
jgi:hypothetical protein